STRGRAATPSAPKPTLRLLLHLSIFLTAALAGAPGARANANHTAVAEVKTGWAAQQHVCDGGPCGDTSDPGPARSLWPFFRDLDLLRLLQGAAFTDGADAYSASVTQCRADLRAYLEGLENFSKWAVQMWDASARAPRGALWGELWQLGSFDECLATDPQPALPGTAFCLAKLRLGVWAADNALEESAWAAFKPPQHRLQVGRHETWWGMCVPASCGPRDLAVVLGQPLRDLAAPHGLDANLTVDPRLWQGLAHVPAGQPSTPASATAWTLLTWLVTWVVFCTIVDSTGKSGSALQAFSVRRNWRAITADDQNDIACIHAAKVICLLAVIFGHRGEALMASPLLNANDLEKVYSSPLDLFVMNGTAVVDMFFVAGGCLLSWTLIGFHQQGRKSSLWALYLFRYARLIPAYAAAIAFLALELPSLGSGPLWGTTVLEEAQRCQRRWWTNLLFINNVFGQDEPCLDPAWYLACDMQLFLVLCPIVLLAPTRPRLVRRLLALAFLFGVLYPAGITWWLRLDGTIVPTPSDAGHMARTPLHMHVYVSAAGRLGPYVAGVAAGWYLRHLQARAAPVPRALRWAAPLLFLLAVAAVALGTVFMTAQPALTPLWARVAYAGLHRSLVGVAFAAGIVAATAADADKSRTSVFAAFRPWSRLSYSAYCTHALVQLYLGGQQRAAFVYSTQDTVVMAIADTCFAFLAALVLHLLVEAPFSRLLSVLRGARTAPKQSGAAATGTGAP
ncbi:O-acyltransferase like protein-like, partial [Frankliniella occidentalis]|uniref:O-acyltransferase like protein-like n=1 Tax=Frankliniella occidentalis TaxID=133901 RepID=A0A9C6U9K0_FRAOC